MRPLRLRLALLLVSAATIGLELALLRTLSLRFWYHFACMVLSVALLGFGASGTALTFLRARVSANPRRWLAGLALALSAAALLAPRAAAAVPLDVHFLAWNFGQAGYVALVELLLLVPFLFAGAFVGITLLDPPDRIPGHYAANLLGSGLGAVLAVLLMHVLSTGQLFAAFALAALGAAWLVVPPRRTPLLSAGVVSLAVALVALGYPWEPGLSPYKTLPYLQQVPGTRIIHRSEGPMGRLDALQGQGIHYAPGLSLRWTAAIPPHVLLLVDGDQPSPVYDCRRLDDWAFLDHTTAAAPYHLCARPRVLIIGSGGGADVGLALYHQSPQIVALEMNPQIIAALRGPLGTMGGRIFAEPNVELINDDARGYLARSAEKFDLIQLPPIDAFGTSGAGLYATQEAPLYTVESFGRMLDHLSRRGILCITRWARTPPRDELRVFDTAVAALRARGLEPRDRLLWIRNWATVTLLALREPAAPEQVQALRAFCEPRGFDLCCLPGLLRDESNRHHVVTHSYYDAAQALLGTGRAAFLAAYPFRVDATTDDRPYFFHTLRWGTLSALAHEPGASGRAFLELGYILLVAALAQAVLLAAAFTILPLVPLAPSLRGLTGRAAAFAYFALIGAGFMLLETSFLQRFVLYLAHPIYSAAAVIAAFLVFGGIGSLVSGRCRSAMTGARLGALAVVALAAAYTVGLDPWLALTQALPTGTRFLVAVVTIAPLAFAMGHLFPSGLRLIADGRSALVPWAWAANGFASVLAAVATPLLAMDLGFTLVALLAAACYAAAGLLSAALPTR